jgi:type IV fimbrial biogenesis protein FimT
MQMKRDMVCRPSNGGFTLVETLAVIALLAVIGVLATPSFVAWHLRDQVDARARALVSTLAYARSEALRRGARVIVCRIDAVGRVCRPCWHAIAFAGAAVARRREHRWGTDESGIYAACRSIDRHLS